MVNSIAEKPLIPSILGWCLVLAMYLLIAVLSVTQMAPVQTAFMVAAPLGFLGFIFWVLGLLFSSKQIMSGNYKINTWAAFVLSVLPLGLFVYGFCIAVNGGV